jgi:hypothetical protein
MNNPPPAWLKPASITILFGIIGITGVLVVLILAGIADPRPVGNQVADDDLTSGDQWTAYPEDTGWDAGEDGLHVKADPESRGYLIAPYAVSCPCTVEISARQTSGARDAHYGVWWGESAEDNHTAAGLNGNGYFGVFSFHNPETSMLIDWHIFPRILPGGESNRLRVNLFEGGEGEILINDEDAAQIKWAGPAIRVGFFVETTTTGGSTVVFERLRLWEVEK